MSSVIDFCQRHDLKNMFNFLRHSGTADCMQAVFAVNLLEELLVGDTVKLEELRAIKAQIHPVTKAAQHRENMKARHAEIDRKKNVVIPELRREIEALRATLDSKKRKTPQNKKPAEEREEESQAFGIAGEEETQAFGIAEEEETQAFGILGGQRTSPPDEESESSTQPGQGTADYNRVMAGLGKPN